MEDLFPFFILNSQDSLRYYDMWGNSYLFLDSGEAAAFRRKCIIRYLFSGKYI